MERSGRLPDRCVACNRPAAAFRLTRKLYWSPRAWRASALLLPVVLLVGAGALDLPILAVLFWPVVLILVVANAFVRKRLSVELGVCDHHRRVRATMITLSLLAVGATVAALALYLTQRTFMPALLVGSIGATLVLALVQPFVGVQRIRLQRLDAEHAWLTETGRPFRDALPELPR